MFEFAESDEASARALTSLYRWLREDSTTRGEVQVVLRAEPRPGELGAADVLTTVLSQLTAIGSLAVAFAAWRDSRSKVPPIRIRLGENSIDVTDGTAEELTVVLKALAAMNENQTTDLDTDTDTSPDESTEPEA